jgi:hypothetical protein
MAGADGVYGEHGLLQLQSKQLEEMTDHCNVIANEEMLTRCGMVGCPLFWR